MEALSESHGLCRLRCYGWARAKLILAIGLTFLVGCTTSQLNTGGQPTGFKIQVHTADDNTGYHTDNKTFVVSALCPSGQQLVGGGYMLTNNKSATTNVVIEASYPSANDTWTILARNPDNAPRYSADFDVIVLALAYCVTTSNYNLEVEIQKSSTTLTSGSQSPQTIWAHCSSSSAVVLSGGFMTSSLASDSTNLYPNSPYYSTHWPALQGSGIAVIGPGYDPSTSAVGWYATAAYTPASIPSAQQLSVTTTVFVMCAKKNLVNQGQIRLAGPTPLGTQTPSAVDAGCNLGEFTVGGGYTLAPTSVASTAIEGNLAFNPTTAFSTWEVRGNSTIGANLTSAALCIPIPIF